MRIFRVLRSLSFIKGKVFTIIGFLLIALAGYVVYEAKDISAEAIELLITGLALAGVNNETIDHLRNRKSDSDSQP
jgi:uncharacterized membrane protein